MSEQEVQRIVMGKGQQELPPLPSNSNSFWKDGQVVSQEVQPFRDCDHYFISKPDAIECKICHLGLPGLKAQDGKLLKLRR